MKIWLSIILLLSILALGCQKQNNIVWVEEEPFFIIDKNGNVLDNKEWNQVHHDSKKTPNAQIRFQSNRLIINFENGTSLILKPNQNSCEEWINEKPIDSCQEECFLAAICKDEEINTVICANDTAFWELSVQLSHTKEGIDSTSIKIKKFKNQRKALQGRLVLQENLFNDYF